MTSKMGFFEKGKLDKLAQSIGDPYIGNEEAKKKYLKVAEECGVNQLIRIAEVLDSMPKDWENGAGRSGHNKLILENLTTIGLSKMISPNDPSP
jgi:hypothetical protein